MSTGTPLTYDEAKRLASNKDPAVRRDLANRADAPPEILFFLSADPDAEVRRAVAANPASPRQADLQLTQDSDDDVRTGLARKLARLLPDLNDQVLDRVRQQTVETLDALARDEIVRVRQILSEALKDIADAPPEIILRLARDAEAIVSSPILEFSPVLTDQDLLDIVAELPASEALSAISRRDNLGGAVSDAIAETNDEQAIAFLLANTSAQIREETLDGILEKAPKVIAWHGPLVRRPKLPGPAAARLAHFVADNLLHELQTRDDLPPDVVAQVAQVVNRRIDADHAAPLVKPAILQKTFDTMSNRFKNETLVADLVEADLEEGRTAHVIAGLAIRAKIAPAIAERMLASGDPSDILALAGLAWMSMSFAEKLQTRIGKVRDDHVVRAVGGGFPLTKDQMQDRLKAYGKYAA